MLIIDVLIEIFNLLNVKSQINMISISHYLKNKISITDLYYCDTVFKYNVDTNTTNIYFHDNIVLKKLTTKILKQKIFIKVTKLNANYNKLITDISFIKN